MRIVLPDKPFIEAAEAELMKLTETKETHDAFFEKLENRWKAYRKLAKTSLIDVSEMELWMQYMLPDYDPELIAAHASRLTRLWRDHDGRRVARPDVKETLEGLDRMGYTMGIIANTVTETEIPDWMVTDHVAHYFKTTILSSKVRLRKPDPEIFLKAIEHFGVEKKQAIILEDGHNGSLAAKGGGLRLVLVEDMAYVSDEDRAYADLHTHNLSDVISFLEREK